MKTPNHSLASPNSAFTLTELLILISILAIIAALVFPALAALRDKAALSSQLNNGRQIYLAMRVYAGEAKHAGTFPLYKDPADKKTIVTTSNDAFEILLGRYLDDKKIFANSRSAYCIPKPHVPAPAENRLFADENDWAYVRGLTDSSPGGWPILANAFAPGTTTYVKDQKEKGGVWRGINAVVIWNNGAAEVVETHEKDGDYLAGENVKVLEPR